MTRLYDYKLKNSNLLSQTFENTILNLEKENFNCHLLPTSLDYKIYENKKEVYRFFDYANIKYPKTFIVNNINSLDEIINQINYPIITKHPFSCSSFGMNNFEQRQQQGESATDVWKRNDYWTWKRIAKSRK